MLSEMIRFPELKLQQRLARLEQPEKPVVAVLDTDTYNEVDDQFALAYALLSEEKLQLRAVTAAPFFNDRSAGPGDGMTKSYDEILRVLDLLGRSGKDFAFKGAERYLPDRNTPVDTPAARRIVELAREAKAKNETLHVLAIAALTNVASALLLAPEIVENTVVVWLGGNPVYWPNNDEFNLRQDVPAAQVVFDSGVPLLWIPCMTVAELLLTSAPELEALSRNSGKLGEFLVGRTRDYMAERKWMSKTLWDISTVAAFTVPEAFYFTYLPTPVLQPDRNWQVKPGRHMLKMVRHINRDLVFADLFAKLDKFAAAAR